jgi:RNA polymerase sigma factor (sigma-70 family)
MSTRLAQSQWRSLDTLFNTGTLGSLTDPELLDCFRSDRGSAGQEAFRILVERHGPMVLGLCRSLVPDPHEAEDAFQATFLVLVRKGHAIWVRDSVGPWLYGVASRVARRARRRTIQRRRTQLPLVVDVADARPGASPVEGAGSEQVIQQEIANLPARLRAPVVLCALEGLSYDAAARQLGVSEPTLRGRLYRARRRLEARLHKRGVLSPLAATAGESLRLGMPVPTPALIHSTVQHAAWWLSVGLLVAGESAIPASIAALARDVIWSMLLGSCKVLGIVAMMAAAVLGTVVSAQQGKPAAPVALAARPTVHSQDPGPAISPRPLPPQFQALVAQHEEHQKRVRTLKCTIVERASIDGGQNWRDMATWKVWKSGPTERIQSSTLRTMIGAVAFKRVRAPGGERDSLLTPDRVWSMEAYQTAHPPAKPVAIRDLLNKQIRIGGMIQPPQPYCIGGYRTGRAADYLLLTLVDVQSSLRDLCETEVNANSKPIERRDTQGGPLWDLTFQPQPGFPAWDVRKETMDRKYYSYVVTLSSRHGNSIIDTDRTTRVDRSEKGTSADLVIHDRMQVLEFQEPAPGIFLPKRIRVTRVRSDSEVNPFYLGETVIQDVQVNVPVTEQELAFHFPQGIGVADVKKGVFYIWGDGAPAETLTTEQYNERKKLEILQARGQVAE